MNKYNLYDLFEMPLYLIADQLNEQSRKEIKNQLHAKLFCQLIDELVDQLSYHMEEEL